MKNLTIKILSFVSIAIGFFACKKDAATSEVPVIKLISISSTSVKQFTDSLSIVFEYTDGDGDIGNINPDENNLQVKDKRLSKADYYFVKPLAPPDSKIKIKGQLVVQLKNTFLLGTSNTEVTSFELKLRDRKGNWSNTILTPNITITK
ncbi:MAG: hypothetical protein HQ463_01005 [Bacteroidetes bacterium]|nr:hypothetical protein [Bacteroidota bacterium]